MKRGRPSSRDYLKEAQDRKAAKQSAFELFNEIENLGAQADMGEPPVTCDEQLKAWGLFDRASENPKVLEAIQLAARFYGPDLRTVSAVVMRRHYNLIKDL